MSALARRDFLKFLGVAGATAFVPGIASSSMNTLLAAGVAAQPAGSLGTVVRIGTGPVVLHTYTAPDASFLVTTHIIETPNRLVVVDTQLLPVFAADVRAYIDSLGKPVERVILSHEHPDHWGGSISFSDLPFFATENTIANVNASLEGGMLEQLAATIGDGAPTEANPPTEVIGGDSDTIDGIALEYQTYTNHESLESLVIGVPEANALIVQDLMYNGAHFFPGLDRDNWLATLEDIRSQDGYDLLLVGHGIPTTKGTLDVGIEYLTFVQETIPTVGSAAELTEAILAKYPTYGGAGITSFWEQFFATS